jgi:methyl-accepting chemotaxis protein
MRSGKMGIGARLGWGFVAVLAFAIVITGVGAWQLRAVGEAAEAMMQLPLKKERLISDWHGNISVAVARTTAIAKSSDAGLVPFFQAAAAATAQSTADLLVQIEPLISSPAERAVMAQIMDIRKAYISSRDQVSRLKADGAAEQADALLVGTFVSAANGYLGLVAELLNVQRAQLDAMAAEIQRIERNSQQYFIALGALAVALGALLAWRLTVGITRPLRAAVAVSRRVADGDLSADIVVHATDELGQLMRSLRDMNQSLGSVVGRVRAGTDSIATASTQIAQGNQDLSSRTEQQASALQQTAASMEQLTSTVKQNANNASQANQLAVSASAVAMQGNRVVGEVVGTMGAITASSKKIVDIIGVIDGIAFQTNILALNAAVEAARAGDQGRGFAVVASEVRSLAQRSAAAAKEIKVLIDDSVDKVEEGSQQVALAGSTMQEIVGSVQRVTDIMGEISAASQEQTAGIEQINRAIAQMDQVTQQNAALVEESAAAAQSMQGQSGELSKMVSVFQLRAA